MKQDEETPDDIAAVRAAFDKSGWSGVLRGIVDSKRPYMAAAAANAQLGELDKAFESLEKLFDRRAIMLIHIGRDPRLDPLRNDPRFDDLLRRIGVK